MAGIFISYSRKDVEAVRKLIEAFKGQDLDFWIDWDGIAPTVDWWREIEKGIEEADIFLFLLSPDSARSKFCKQEIDHAVKNGKRLIPVVIRDVQGEEAPAELSHLNWIFFRETDDFQTAFERLITAIRTDYTWVQAHRQLQVKALEWERSGRENSFLLFGKELHDAEFQLATNTSKEPHPTNLQREYVHASRRAVDRRRKRNTAITTIAAVVLAALTIFGFVQAGLAQDHARISRVKELAAQSVALRNSDPDLSSLLSVEAYGIEDIPETRAALLGNAPSQTQLVQYLYGQTSSVSSVIFNHDGTMIASGGCSTFNEVSTDCTRGEIIIWDVAGNRIGQPLTGHPSRVRSLAFSPDGKMLASGDRNGSILLWDMDTFQPVKLPLIAHSGTVSSLVFSEDGKTLISTSYDYNEIILWDLATYDFEMLDGAIISPDGKMLATVGCSSDDNSDCTESITIIERSTGKSTSIDLPYSLTFSAPGILAFSPDGKTLALDVCKLDENNGCVNYEIILWNVKTSKPIDPLLIGHTGPVDSLVFSQDGTRLASGVCLMSDYVCTSGEIIVWDVRTHQRISPSFQGYPAWQNGFALSQDGKILASGNYDNKLTLWNAEEPINQYLAGSTPEAGAVMGLREDGKLIAVANCKVIDETSGGCTKTQIHLWDSVSQKQLDKPVIEIRGEVFGLTLSADGKFLAAITCQSFDEYTGYCGENEVLLWDIPGEQSSGLHLPKLNDASGDLTFSPDSNTLAAFRCQSWNEYTGYCEDSEIILWDVIHGKRAEAEFLDMTGEIRSLVFSQNNRVMAASVCQKLNELGFCLKGEVVLWDVVTHQRMELSLTKLTGILDPLALSQDGKTLAFVNCLQYDTNGNSLCLEGEIILWNVANDKRLNASLSGLTGDLMSLTFSPNGKVLAAGGCTLNESNVCSKGQTILWDMSAKKPDGWMFDDYNSRIDSVKFITDDVLVSKGDRGNVSIWDTNPHSLIQKSCQRVGRNLTQSEWNQYWPNEPYRKTCEQWPKHASYYQTIAEEVLSNSQHANRVQIALDKVSDEIEQDRSIAYPISESHRIVGREIERLISESLTNTGLLEEANALGLDLDLSFLNNLCENGSLEGYAEETLQYCEQAVLLDPAQ
jgi:WD40 repeat protein